MAIVASEVESIHGDPRGQRMIFYRFQDETGVWHSYGPVITSDPDLDLDAQRELLAIKIAERMAAEVLE